MNIDSGKRLKLAREALDMTQDIFAQSIGLKRVNITNLEGGKVKISTLHALAIEYVHNIDANWLLTGKGGMFKSEPQRAANGDVIPYEHPTEAKHMKLVKEFKNKDLALELSSGLVKLEEVDEESLYEINDIIKLKLKRKGALTKTSKQQGRVGGKQGRQKA